MIHPTAIVESTVELSDDVEIGPYAVLSGHVRIGRGVRIDAHAQISGWTTLGDGCEVHAFSIVGDTPQDHHFKGGRSYLEIGPRTMLREFSVIHRSSHEDQYTRIGADCMIMVRAHIAHDCVLGDGVVITNDTVVSGHCEIGDHVVISASVMISQFVRIGRRCMISGGAKVKHSIPPFSLVDYDGAVSSINVIGLRRAGFENDLIAEIRQIYKRLYRSEMTFQEALEFLRNKDHSPEGQEMVDFITQEAKIPIAGPPLKRRNRAQNREPHASSNGPST